FAFSTAAFAGLTLWPVALGQYLGAATVLLLAISMWVTIGSAMVYFANRYRFPVATLALCLAVVASPYTDNHAIRTLDEHPKEPGLLTADEALDVWLERVSSKYPLPEGRSRPLYLVAAAGGGIRAAYWTAIVLGELEDESISRETASFAEHSFALSGVS